MLHKSFERRETKCANGSIENFFFCFFSFCFFSQLQNGAIRMLIAAESGVRLNIWSYFYLFIYFGYRTQRQLLRTTAWATRPLFAAVTKLYPLVVCCCVYSLLYTILAERTVGRIDFITIIHNGNASTNKKLKASRSTTSAIQKQLDVFFFFLSSSTLSIITLTHGK